MPDESKLVQVSLGLDIEQFKQGLSQAQAELQTMQQGVARMNQQSPESPVVASAPAGSGAPPPLPPLPAPTPPPSAPESPGAVQTAWAEMERIKQISKASPDVALMQLQGAGGDGGLARQIAKGAAGASTPEEQEAYQELLRSLKDLTSETRKQAEGKKGEDPMTNMLGLMRNNMLLQGAGMVGNQIASGDVLGGLASGGGMALGTMLGGPAGGMAGAQLGQMLSGLLAPFLGGASEAEQMAMQRADISARFGDFGNERGLRAEAIAGMDTSGYNTNETMDTFDSLRRSRVISGVDGESTAMVEQIQALTRALGENTEAVIADYARYENAGGTGSASDYMAQMIAGSVSAGMRENLDQYREIVGSAQVQMVQRSAMGDYDGKGMQGVQGILNEMMGQNNRTAELLRDNPSMTQQMLSGLLSTGATRSGFSADASLMQMAGIDAAHTTEGYISAGTQTQNALQRQAFISQNFLSQALPTMGFENQSQLFAAAQANPNLIQDLLSDRNPNTGQARSLQGQLDVQIATAMGKPLEALTGQDRQLTMQMLQSFIGNGGSLAPDAVTADGTSLQQLVQDSQKTEADRARDAIAENSKKIAQLLEELQPIFTDVREGVVDLSVAATDLILALEPLKAIGQVTQSLQVPQQMGGFVGDVQTTAQQVRSGNTMGAIGTVARRGAQMALENSPGAIFNRMSSATWSALGGLFGGGQSDNPVDAEFNDTPMSGVVAGPGFNTFRFASGDRVFAAQPGSGGGQGGGINATIQVNLTVPNGATEPWMEQAARRGATAGMDEFTAQWRARDRGGVRDNRTNY